MAEKRDYYEVLGVAKTATDIILMPIQITKKKQKQNLKK